MLSKPGEARSKTTAAPSTRRRKVAEENWEDVVRKLQRLPCNKVCADCQSKLPQCVNLSHGTFICMACSGVHREFSHKIKGIGHSSFTAEEVAMLRHPHSGNEAVNARYLAKYSSHDRMRPPKDNSDLHALRAWIQRKYIDKAWLTDVPGGAGDGDGAPTAPPKQPPSTTPQTAPPGRRKIMPSVSTGAANASHSGDLFGFDSIAPSSSSSADPFAAKTDSWDAFGTSSSQTQHVVAKPEESFADFGSASSSSSFQPDFGVMMDHAPHAAPSFAPSFPAEFGTTSWQGQSPQPTVVSLPPPPPPQSSSSSSGQESFANFDSPQVSQPPAFPVNFDERHPQGQQPSMFRANFDQPSMQMPSAPVDNARAARNDAVTTTTNRGDYNFDSFRPNLDQISMSNQSSLESNPQIAMTQPPNPNYFATTNQQTEDFGSFEANFNDADSSFPIQQPAGAGMNFGNFVQPQGTTTETSQQQQQQQQQTQQSPQMPQISLPQGTGTIPPMNSLPGGDTMKQQQVDVDNNDANPTVEKPSDSSSPPVMPVHPQEGNPTPPAVNPNAFRSVEEDKLSAFDAFEGLSLEPTPALIESSEANHGISGIVSNGGDSKGPSVGNSMVPIPDALKLAKVQETAMMLQNLSLEQLIQVQQYIASLGSMEPEAMSHSYGGGVALTMNGNGTMGNISNQPSYNGMGSVGWNGMASSDPDMSMQMGGAINFNSQPAMSQFQQFSAPQMQPMGMGPPSQNDRIPEPSVTNPSAPAALPPVEKEGNPFDMY